MPLGIGDAVGSFIGLGGTEIAYRIIRGPLRQIARPPVHEICAETLCPCRKALVSDTGLCRDVARIGPGDIGHPLPGAARIARMVRHAGKMRRGDRLSPVQW
jgi:hypothetical protein